jgi:hypothetical protein
MGWPGRHGSRGRAGRHDDTSRRQPLTRVDAGMKELYEMTIGRTDDPENPLRATAFKSRIIAWDWIADPIWASGHGAASTGRTHDRNRPARQTSQFCSCIQGAVHTWHRGPAPGRRTAGAHGGGARTGSRGRPCSRARKRARISPRQQAQSAGNGGARIQSQPASFRNAERSSPRGAR